MIQHAPPLRHAPPEPSFYPPARRRPERHRARRCTGREGQALIFLMLALVILAFVGLWLFDVHKLISVKALARNGGDAAALAAARWQGQTLNLIGALNGMQALAISDALGREEFDASAAEAIADLQARLCFVGPLLALEAAQQAAKNNGIYARPAFSQRLSERATTARNQYALRFEDPPYENQPSPPTAWDDYADMLDAIAEGGVAAWPENARWYINYIGMHLLLNPSFYDAVASSDWCWFFFNALGILEDYRSFLDWPPLPLIVETSPDNAEVFGLHLRRWPVLAWLPALDARRRAELLSRLGDAAGAPVSSNIVPISANWFCYRTEVWSSWSETLPDHFPFAGQIRRQYDYAGADAAVRVEAVTDRLTPGATAETLTWTAAAKSFGSLDGSTLPTAFSVVLPAFHSVRLVPVDASSAPAAGSRPGWIEHLYDHLPLYADFGPFALSPNCWYCRCLIRWEDPDFRKSGLTWLEEFSEFCLTQGPGSGSRGGTRRGH